MALIDSLVAYYPCDEASGNLLDAHASLDWTDNNTVQTATGVINNGRDFEKGNVEYFTIANSAEWQTGDIDISFSFWGIIESFTSFSVGNIISKSGGTGEYSEYDIYISGDTFKPAFRVRYGGSNRDEVIWGSALSTGTLYHIACGHDSVNNLLWITVNDGTPVTKAYSLGILAYTGSNGLGFGADRTGSFASRFDGIIDEFGFWKKTLSSSEITELYNGGAGLAYPFSAGGTTAAAAQALAGISQSAAAAVAIAASSAQTLGSISQSATSTVAISAAVAQAIASANQSAAAAVAISAAVAQAIASANQSVAAQVLIVIAGAQTLGGISQAVTASAPLETITAAIAQQLGGVSQASTAMVLVQAAGGQTLAAITQAATGEVVITATSAQTLAAINQALAGKVAVSASITQTLAGITQALQASGELIPTVGWVASKRARGWTPDARLRGWTASKRARGWTPDARLRGWTASKRARGWVGGSRT